MVIALVSAFALAAVPAFADPTVASKQAEAQSVLGQIQQLDSSLERAVEAYNLANIKLSRIKHDLSTNTHSLTVAKKSLKNAQKELSSRLVDLYTSDEGQDSGLAVLLGSASLDEMLSRMDAADRVSQQDSLVLRQVAHLRREVQRRQRELQHAHGEQVQVVAERDAARSSIQSQLGQRQALLGSIRGEIANLQAQEREKGFREWLDEDTGGRLFFRQGKSGTWPDELSDAQVARIETEHHAMMTRLGYAPVTAGTSSMAGT